MELKLTIELVPSSCWFSNVRDHVTSQQWSEIKLRTFENAGYVCEVCSSVGEKWPVECHETWEYDDENKIQRLVGTVALCPNCHLVKHIGFASTIGKGEHAKSHFAAINCLTMRQVSHFIGNAFNQHEERSKHTWKLDLSWLKKEFNIKIDEKR